MCCTKSILTLITSLFVVVLFVVAINLTNNSRVTASSPTAFTAASQDSLGKFNPIEETEKDEEEAEEEEGKRDEEDEDEGEWDEEEGDDEDEHEEGDEEEEFEFEEMELERMEIESNIGRLETINRLAEIAKDDTAMASYAIMHLEEYVEDEDEAIDMLEELIESDKVAKPVKNLLKMKLAEVYSWQDRNESALKIFKSMLMSK